MTKMEGMMAKFKEEREQIISQVIYQKLYSSKRLTPTFFLLLNILFNCLLCKLIFVEN